MTEWQSYNWQLEILPHLKTFHSRPSASSKDNITLRKKQIHSSHSYNLWSNVPWRKYKTWSVLNIQTTLRRNLMSINGSWWIINIDNVNDEYQHGNIHRDILKATEDDYFSVYFKYTFMTIPIIIFIALSIRRRMIMC